jgi:hypothetical protein
MGLYAWRKGTGLGRRRPVCLTGRENQPHGHEVQRTFPTEASMKKIVKKRLVLSKATVANLDKDAMNRIIGASIVIICTESCSVAILCCTPKTKEKLDQMVGLANG